jgi:hypothetical protein
MTDRSARMLGLALENPADRRGAPRLRAEDVPWIVTVRLRYGDAARLVDISRTGLLLETTERLRPGQKGVMTLGLAGNRSTHVDSHIVRSRLVALSSGAVPLYQAAVLFVNELESKLLAPTGAPVEDEGAAEGGSTLWSRRLDGPLDALWATERGSELARVTNLSETGCITHGPTTIGAGELAAVTIFFTPVRRLLLTGRVVSTRSDGGCDFRFEGLNAEQRRSLRVELTSHASRWTSTAPMSSADPLRSIGDAEGNTWAYTAGLQASDW